MVTSGCGMKKSEYSCFICTISVWGDEKVLEMHSSDGYAAMWLYLMPLNCAHRNGLNGKCYAMCISPPHTHTI